MIKIKKVMPPFFLIKIPKKDQRERLEKIGVLYYPPEFTFMKRGMQCGEIVMIGEAAHKYFPEAKVGDILINHHLCEGKQTDNKQKVYMIDEDADWNYYVITGYCHNGERNMTFAVWNGKKIITNQDYIFLEVPKEIESDLPDFDMNIPGFGRVVTNMPFHQAANGIVAIKHREKSREELIAKMKENTIRIKQLSRWIPIMREKVAPQIQDLEFENERMSMQVNKKKCEYHEVAACNRAFTIETSVSVGDSLYITNFACYMKVEFMNKEYIIAETKYVQAHPDSEF